MAREQVVVIGLGRFGSAVAREMERLGHEVLAIDRNEQRVNDIAPDVTHALQLDAADEDALRGAGAGTSRRPSSRSAATPSRRSSRRWC
jgi:trk system potassium uptake protein TrkA